MANNTIAIIILLGVCFGMLLLNVPLSFALGLTAFSKSLYEKLKKMGKVVEYYEYEGSDHNISQEFNLAIQRSVEFFNKYLK